MALLSTIAADTTAMALVCVPVTAGGARLRPARRMTAVG